MFAQAVVNNDLDFDVRILRQQFREFRQKNGVGCVFGRSDPNRASRFLTQVAHRRDLSVDLFEARADGLEEAVACLRWRHAAGGAGKEPHPETRLKFANGVTERRLRHAELCGRSCEAALLGNR
jgi:hypothetical protein